MPDDPTSEYLPIVEETVRLTTRKVTTGRVRIATQTEEIDHVLPAELSSTEVEYRDASFEFHGDDITVVPSKDGVIIKWKETLGDLQGKALELAVMRHNPALSLYQRLGFREQPGGDDEVQVQMRREPLQAA